MAIKWVLSENCFQMLSSKNMHKVPSFIYFILYKYIYICNTHLSLSIVWTLYLTRGCNVLLSLARQMVRIVTIVTIVLYAGHLQRPEDATGNVKSPRRNDLSW